jgi:hypothetical protein
MLPRTGVVVPFAERIADRIACQRIEVRRAFPQLLAVIQATALLHHRQRGRDASGSIVADVTDYQIARRLLVKSFTQTLGGGISEAAVTFWGKLKAANPGAFTAKEVAKACDASESSVKGWLPSLESAGAVEKVEIGRGPNPTIWRLTGAAPDMGATILPTGAEVFPETSRPHGHNTERL